MRDGDIIDGQAWFGFDAEELNWLLDYIPASDAFRDDIQAAIRKLEAEQ